MKILIIYENIPESTDYFICDVSPDSQDLLDFKWCHHKYVNDVDNKELDKVLMRVYYRLYGLSEDEPLDEVDWCHLEYQEIGKYKNSKLDMKEMLDVKSLDIDYVVVTGFIC